MNVLIIGSGGREHALAWKLEQSLRVRKVYMSPGNSAPFEHADVDSNDPLFIASFCEWTEIGLIVIGPEAPLAAGIVDELKKLIPNVLVFGPCTGGAALESSKSFAKRFMKMADIRTADYQVFKRGESFEEFLDSCSWEGIVVKDDGLAAGKGVIVANTKEEAKKAAEELFENSNCHRILFEERLFGYEISALAFFDGKSYSLMPFVQDHKRLLDNDQGPNTGGMGVIAPLEVSDDLRRQVVDIFDKTLDELSKPYIGVLFAGLMVVQEEIYVLEYNCRFGDPECEVLMRLLETDLCDVLLSCTLGTLSTLDLQWSNQFACGVVLASAKYPYSSDINTPITYVPPDNCVVRTFHAGAKQLNDQIVTNGGRIMCVTALADSLEEARKKANQAAESVRFEGKQFRTDIGVRRELKNCVTYAASGVNIEQGNAFVSGVKKLTLATLLPGTEQIGGFGARIDLPKAGFPANTQLVVGIDGVGTKLEVATVMNDFSMIGHDVVAMCVNDVLCHCAQPIAFLDYYVCGKLDREIATKVVASIAEACLEAQCSLIGGETAEMPGVYFPHQWDLAGCAIAARKASWPNLPESGKIEKGDFILGLSSNGLHSNGFSLARSILKVNGVSYDRATPWNKEKSFGEILLAPTKIYVKSVLPVLKTGLVKGCAHITGGGLLENIVRVTDPNSDNAVEIDCASWPLPEIFQWLACHGPVSPTEMLKTFNCGIGMVLIVSQSVINEVERHLFEFDLEIRRIGMIVEKQGDELITFKNKSSLFNYKAYPRCERRKVKVAILISGVGSNMVKLIERSRQADSNCEIVIVVSNNKDAPGLKTAASMGIRTAVNEHTRDRVTGDRKLYEILNNLGVEMICLAGYMRILAEKFVIKFKNRIINVHPSLLPAFKGKNALHDALAAGVKIVGCTVHFVDELVDHGPIIAQQAINVEDGDTYESLQKKIQCKEHIIFPESMNQIANKILQSSL
ncbi:unnamed protein product [Caenorhabditis auriculariae]|uniref:Trifunctional purine biosynthetic protein adenosine-3 n=1 Tax=Caenorhabditis auriculariae TaxID=2777116 RepID=A0A8S1GRB0_9PELO|nr:unnamed protein product [Caenorhabditis auriculariae]